MSSAKRVLIVDDDDTYRTALARAFERRGFAVSAASSASEALALIEREPPDYASIDLRMPGGSGLALVRQLELRYPGKWHLAQGQRGGVHRRRRSTDTRQCRIAPDTRRSQSRWQCATH